MEREGRLKRPYVDMNLLENFVGGFTSVRVQYHGHGTWWVARSEKTRHEMFHPTATTAAAAANNNKS